MNISKEQFTELAKEHLVALESYRINKKGKQVLEIFGIEKLYEAINYTHCCKSDREQLCECDAPLIRTSDKGGEYCGSCEKDLD